MFEEVSKATYEDCKEEDTPEEQQRKLQEKNYNTRVQAHIKDAIFSAVLLHSRYSAPLTEPLPYKKALEFANILQKAYKGQLEPIQINPYMKPEYHAKALANGKLVSQCFPMLLKNIEAPKKSKDLAPGAGLPVLIAPKQFVVSIAEKKVALRYEYIVETKASSLKALDKQPIDGFACDVIPQSIRRQGSSISVIVQQYIQLILSLVTKPKKSSY